MVFAILFEIGRSNNNRNMSFRRQKNMMRGKGCWVTKETWMSLRGWDGPVDPCDHHTSPLKMVQRLSQRGDRNWSQVHPALLANLVFQATCPLRIRQR